MNRRESQARRIFHEIEEPDPSGPRRQHVADFAKRANDAEQSQEQNAGEGGTPERRLAIVEQPSCERHPEDRARQPRDRGIDDKQRTGLARDEEQPQQWMEWDVRLCGRRRDPLGDERARGGHADERSRTQPNEHAREDESRTQGVEDPKNQGRTTRPRRVREPHRTRPAWHLRTRTRMQGISST